MRSRLDIGRCGRGKPLLGVVSALALGLSGPPPAAAQPASPAATPPAVNVQLTLDPVDSSEGDAGIAVVGGADAREPTPSAVEDSLRASMNDGLLTNALRRRRAYPVTDLAERDVKRGNIAGAIAGYERYLETDPRHLVIRWRLIQLLRSRGMDREIVVNADALLQSAPGFGPAVVERAESLANLSQLGPAMAAYVQALGQSGLPPSARRRALAGLVNVAIASGQLGEADRLLRAEPPGTPGSPTARALLAARATLAERGDRPAEAAALWGRIAAGAPAAERRRAVLAQAQLLDQAHRPHDALDLLRAEPVRALLAADGDAPLALRLRYARLVSVLAEQVGQTAVAADASAAAAALARQGAGTNQAEQSLPDRMRAARLAARRADAGPDAALGFLADDAHPLPRPAGVADAVWADYLLLLAETAQRAGRAPLAIEALGLLPPAAAPDRAAAARAAELAARAGQKREAAAYWARAATIAQTPRDRRAALLSQAQLLESAGDATAALAVLRTDGARADFEAAGDDAAAAADRLRYYRLVSVLAEHLGRGDVARQAAEQAASLQASGAAAAPSAQALVDRLRAARLQSGGDGRTDAVALPPLLGADGQPLARPADADDALWLEYALLLGDAADRSRQPAKVHAALTLVPPAALADWHVAAHVGELALRNGQPGAALAALRPWDARALGAAGADRQAVLTVLTLRADAAGATGQRALEGTMAAEIEAIDPRIGNPLDRARRRLATGDAAGAVAVLQAARPAAQARLAEGGPGAGPGAGPEARHAYATLLLTLAETQRQAGKAADAAQTTRESLDVEESWDQRWALAEELRRARDRAGAAVQYRRAAQLARTPAETQLAWLTLGDLHWTDKSYGPAFEAFRSAVAAGSGVAGRTRLAEAADKLGRYAEEARALEPLAGTLTWRERLCQVYLKAGQRAEASRCLGALVAMAGSDAGAWHEAADLAGALGQDADRTRYLETAFRLQPRPDTGLAAGDALMRAGQPAEAAAMFGAVAERTRDPRALVARGEALLAAHQPGTAAESFRAAQAQGELPEDLQARAYAGLGYARAADGDTPGAVGAWQSALKLRPDPQLSLAVADGLLRAGRTDDAERALAQAGPGPARGSTRSAQRDALAVRLAIARGDTASALRAAETLANTDPSAANLALLAQARSASGDETGAAEASVRAADAAPDDAQAQAQAGYAELKAGRPGNAAARFSTALAREPDRLPVRQDLPRAHALAGDWPDARLAYAEAIRRTEAHQAATGDTGDAQRLHDLRRENAAATREFAFELVDTLCAPSTAVGCGLSLPIIERLGSAGIGALTASWSPHLPGDPDPQRLTVYARTLWSNDPGSLSPLGRTFQGGIGIRWHPVSNIPVYLWAERLIALGRTSQDNWLLRVTAGWAYGADWKVAGEPDWRRDWTPYLSIYGDLGKFFIRDRDWLGVLEGRAGASHQPFEQAMLTPYLFLRGELDSARTGSAESLQIGAGLSLRTRFLHDPLIGYQLEPEFFARASHDIARTGGRTAMRFLFGVIAHF